MRAVVLGVGVALAGAASGQPTLEERPAVWALDVATCQEIIDLPDPDTAEADRRFSLFVARVTVQNYLEGVADAWGFSDPSWVRLIIEGHCETSPEQTIKEIIRYIGSKTRD